MRALVWIAFPLMLLGVLASRRSFAADPATAGDVYFGPFEGGDDGYGGASFWPAFDTFEWQGTSQPAAQLESGPFDAQGYGEAAPAPVYAYGRGDPFGVLTPDMIEDAAPINFEDVPEQEAEGGFMQANYDPVDVAGGGNVDKIKGLLASQRGPVENVDAFEPFVLEAAGTYGVRPEIIRSLIYRESRYRPTAKNPSSSALGLMQVLRGTATDMGFDYASLIDPRTAILCGTKYLAIQIAQFGEVDGVRAYYAGPGNIIKERKYGTGSTVTAEADRYAEGVFANV